MQKAAGIAADGLVVFLPRKLGLFWPSATKAVIELSEFLRFRRVFDHRQIMRYSFA